MNRLLREAAEAATAASPHVPAVLIAVRSDAGDLWQHAQAADGRLLDPQAVTRTASATKTVTAATAVSLHRAGRLSLDEPVRPLLPAPFRAVLDRAAVAPVEVTVAALLQHTAGLADYATDELWLTAVTADPARPWTPLELADWCADSGAAAPARGRYAYSDTGYVLLGAAIEAVTGGSLAAAYRAALALNGLRVWLEGREAPTAPHVRAPLSAFGFDGWSLSPSVDNYGGGGLVSDMASMTTWFRDAVDVIAPWDQVTIDAGDDGSAGYGVFDTPSDLGRAWRHDGALGSFAVRLPECGLTIAASICSAHGDFARAHPKAALWQVLCDQLEGR